MPGKLRCYVASPLGFFEAGRHYYAEVLLPALSQLVEPVDPWALVSKREIAAARKARTEKAFAAEIGRRNTEALKSSRLLFAVLDGQEVDSGTAAEIGYASALGLTCLGLRTDLRKTGERGATVNLQIESFLIVSGGSIAASLDALLAKDLPRAIKAEIAKGRSA
ncbi:MAG TPA: nucleoside 2-deoxyribosyltransferase [Solirubrobacterales bacterium]|jgi:nucleoside 2-deoxyribosyltransferase